jgi:hypothetical protein
LLYIKVSQRRLKHCFQYQRYFWRIFVKKLFKKELIICKMYKSLFNVYAFWFKLLSIIWTLKFKSF